ncbi:hypothetical protein ANTHELSMS3_03482 [Antarctobacter heliothermus]|uniref:Uncharacterized protein n=1 Tax=Antarctobacter heliothermus TaxID=74033 RepID=A0A222E7B3_9RHOB|nr:hypothetical protein [Antarctobacter heliothermus]ASP22109.1 hypothetical protein ANTHELSMS3_03482 [Antarctobacter heliothermus]
MTKDDAIDPKGLMADAYAIEGITAEECRSIFLDWALSLPEDVDMQALIGATLARHGTAENHPMTQVLRDGLATAGKSRRRGGWKSRPRPDMDGA